MPHYVFQKVGGEEVTEFYYHMNDAPKIGAVIEVEGVQWKRLTTKPQAAFAGLKAIDPYSAKEFINKTGNMKGTIGDLWDASKELSARRAEKEGGVDPVKAKYYADYKKRKRGTPHTQELADGHKAAKEHFQKGLKKISKEFNVDL